MIILIGGCSSVGKTLLAQRLLERCLVPYLSADHLKMGLYRADAARCGFTPVDRDDVIEQRLWPILKGIIDTNIENGQNLIIEGCYLFPQRLASFPEAYRRHIIPVFLALSERYIRAHYHTGILRYRNAIERRQGPEERTIAQVIDENRALKTRCDESGVACIEIDGDYERTLERVCQRIAQEVIGNKKGAAAPFS